jgi:hypothetical protein
MPTWNSKKHIKKLHRIAHNPNIDLWFEDECHFQQHGSRCRMWVPPEESDPIVLHAPTRKSIAVFGAVSSYNGRLVTQMEREKFNAESFQGFLEHLLRHRRKGCRMVVVVDNARWHHAKALNEWLDNHKDHLCLDFLPPYSPELNAVERVWKLTRTICTHNRYFPNLEDLVATVAIQLGKWRKPNTILHRLCAIN